MERMSLKDNKYYVEHDLVKDPSIFREEYYLDNTISNELLPKLAKDLGFSYNLYQTLLSLAPEAVDGLVRATARQSDHKNIYLLIDKDKKEVVGYSLDESRIPVLNKDFVNRVLSIVEAHSEVEVSELYYDYEETSSSIIIKKVEPIKVEEKYGDREPIIIDYYVGILLVNDERNSTYSRLVLYVDDHPIYLPASYYNASSSRYRRSTSNSLDALEVLLLKVIDDLRENSLYDKIYDLHFKYRANKQVVTSYEEYNTLLRTMRKIPTIIEDNSYLETLLSRYENFERRYTHLEDKKSSYIWRCTALGDISIDSLVSLTIKILSEVNAPPIEYFAVRELLGTYISTPRIATDIAIQEID